MTIDEAIQIHEFVEYGWNIIYPSKYTYIHPTFSTSFPNLNSPSWLFHSSLETREIWRNTFILFYFQNHFSPIHPAQTILVCIGMYWCAYIGMYGICWHVLVCSESFYTHQKQTEYKTQNCSHQTYILL